MDVRPLHALIAVLVFGSLLALAAFAGLQANTVAGPSELQQDRNGDLHVRIGQRLFVYDRQHTLRDTYTLDDFRVSGLIGNFDFFPDNSLLLVPDEAGAGARRLQRCYRDSRGCTPLPHGDLVLDRSFRVAVDAGGSIYLAHTARDRVYLLAGNGVELDRLPGKAASPNRVRLVDGELVIANTEARDLIVVPLPGGQFADEGDWRRVPIERPPGSSMKANLPLDFFAAQDHWWVLATTVNRQYFALGFYADNGDFLSSIRLPAGGDPVAIAPLGDAIAVADYSGLRVDLYRADGEPLGELTSPAQAAYVDALRKQQAVFRLVQFAAWGLFAVALVAGFAIAVKAEFKKAREKKAAAESQGSLAAATATPKPHHMEARVHWLVASKRPLWLLALVSLLLVAMPIAITVGMPQPDDAEGICTRFTVNVTIWAMLGLLAVVMLPVCWKLRQVVGTRIGVADEWVLVDRGSGPVLVSRDENLLRVANGFIIDGVTIPTGSPQMTLFDKQAMEQWLQPRLDRAQALGPIRQLGWQWRQQRGMFVLTWSLVALGAAVVLGMELGWFEGWFEQWLRSQPACAGVLEGKSSASSN